MSGREQALSLLAQANNHGDLAVKLSSLKQAKDILASADPSLAAELFPYMVGLQNSPESLVRKTLIEAVEEIGLKSLEHLSMLMPVLLALLNDIDWIVARQSIVSGTKIFCTILEELFLQFHRRGIVEKWLEELWTWALRFKDAVCNIIWEAAPLGLKLMALKFLETYALIFTSDSNGSEQPAIEATARRGRMVNISWLVGGHPVLDAVSLTSEANKLLGFLLDMLRSASSMPGPLTISVVNCLAAIARKRPLHYNSILSVLLDFEPNFETVKGHMASIQYSLRTAYLGFLRCTYPTNLESRDRLLSALRGMNAGDAADQVIRQVDKMMKNNERASRDARLTKDDQPASQLSVGGDAMRKRSMPLDHEEPNNGHDVASKRNHHGHNNHSDLPGQTSDSGQFYSVNGVSSKIGLPDNGLTPAEQMIAMIGALIAEGERGAESLELLINQIHPDLFADIVITNMKHLPKNPPPLMRVSSQSVTHQSGPPSVTMPIVSAPPFSSVATSTSLADVSTSINLPADSKRDPRRLPPQDPRRLDPRRAAVPVEVLSMPVVEENNALQSESGSLPVVTSAENTSVPLMAKMEQGLQNIGSPISSLPDESLAKEEILHEDSKESAPALEINVAIDPTLSPDHEIDEDLVAPEPLDIAVKDEVDPSSLLQSEELSPPTSNVTVAEEVCPDLPVLPPYVELTEEQTINVRRLAVERIIESYKYLQGTHCSQTRMALLARLVAQIDTNDDAVVMMQKHVVSDYQLQKGHELVMHVLYHLHTLMISDSVEQSSFAAVVYEKFFLGVAKSLLDALPASDKSFSKLFGEAPFLPGSALKMLDNLCCSDYQCGKGVRDGDRVTQGLGAVWSLIMGRPVNRQACLDIALKCAVHSEEEIRAKAIRLVANKLYALNYISTDIEQFATRMLSSAVDHRFSDIEASQSASTEHRTEQEASERGSQETSISGSQFSEPGTSENDSVKGSRSDSRMDSSLSFAEAQRLISLFFALCTKKPMLLQLVFENYTRAPKFVKQAIHRHIPILIRTLGPSYTELLHIISDPPVGSENLLTQVLNILCEDTIPSADLIATVKHLYETKLKDATILIPILSSLSKIEVLPIFPRLVELPLDKFQTALAHILQGSAHAGPALTPAEVLVVIHGITPEKDGLALKKITDVCTACFEQRTVFTQQVLAKALNQMVDQSPLPLLFMRTVIQAIDAFPSLVDFVMEILSKLVTKQIWRMPKLWVGFIKCVSQTQPHSFRVLLQLPPPQLESTLNKYANLRGPLTAYANQPSLRTSLPRSTLMVLGLVNESHTQQRHVTPSLYAPDTGSSVHGATIT